MPAESKPASWFVYMILADDGSLYTGISTDVQRRWQEHCHSRSSGAKYFRTRKPVKLVYTESSENRSTASRREAEIKRLSRSEKWELIESPEARKTV